MLLSLAIFFLLARVEERCGEGKAIPKLLSDPLPMGGHPFPYGLSHAYPYKLTRDPTLRFRVIHERNTWLDMEMGGGYFM